MKHTPSKEKSPAAGNTPKRPQSLGNSADGADKARVTGVDPIRTPARIVGPLGKIQSRKAILVLTLLSIAASFLMFPSVNWWFLGFVCLVPWLVAVCTGKNAKFVYLASWLFGLGYFFINIRWMIPVTWEGYIAICAYYSLTFPLAAWPIRHMYQRHGLPVAITAPIVWVAMEYLRSLRPLSFPWLFLGHTQYQQITLIQISDLVGVYGVSFVLAMVNGWLADLMIQPILVWRSDHGTRLPIGTLATFVVLAGTLIYGSAQSSTKYFNPGPKVAIIQPDFPMYVDDRFYRTSPQAILDAHVDLLRQAAVERPDLIILPETIMISFINDEFLDAPPTALDEMLRRRYPGWELEDLRRYQETGRQTRKTFQSLSDESGAAILLGGSAMEWKPTDIPPRVEAFNSAFLFLPHDQNAATTQRASVGARYDKIHLVLFGEYVPFRFTHHWLYEWLNSITPWGKDGRDYSLTPGGRFNVMEFPSRSNPGRKFRAGTPICYEEIMPYIGREFTGASRKQKNADMLLAISNDGWFLHTPELEQHLASSVFRAVENRIAIARSVNTGASATVYPNGKVHSRVRMSAEKIARLDGLERVLRDAKREIDGMGVASGDTDIIKHWQALRTLLAKDLDQAIQDAGRELFYFRDRLVRMHSRLLSRDPKLRTAYVSDFRDQVQEDLETIARWRKQPDTAPGWLVEELKLDGRLTLYARWGDVFAQGALVIYLVMIADWLVRRIRFRRA
jgi:apolipoprotein N-acyltransferase